MTSRVKRQCFIGLALIILASGAWAMVHFFSRQAHPDPPQVVFYGLVVDQDDHPVEGVEVVVRTSKYVSNPVMGGSTPGWSTGSTFRISSQADGRFKVAIPANDELLDIKSIRKSGYDWVYDLAWTLGPPHNENDNRQFQLAGYRTDASLPAVFPLHLSSSPKPAGKASRGGFQVGVGGRLVPSTLVPLNVPSAGPNAPQNSKEESDAIGIYLRTKRKTHSK